MKTSITHSALRICIIFAFLFSFTKSLAHDFDVDGIYYNINGNEASVTYRGTSYNDYSDRYVGDITIPSNVIYNGVSYSVTGISNYAFYRCTGLTSINFPPDLICKITSIGNYAFFGCTGLEDFTIPESIISIGDYAFRGCSSLETLNFYAINCADLSDLFNNPFRSLNITTINLGDSVQKIPANFANGLTKLNSVNIPNSVKSIGNSAFEDCSGLTSVNIPNSVTNIGNSAFYGCSSLTDVYSSIADPSMVSMGNKVFYLYNEDYSNRRLHVPLGSIPAYRVDQKWRTYFATIEDEETVVDIELKGELQIVEGGNEVHNSNTSISYDQLWITYTGYEDVEFTILFDTSFYMAPGGGGSEKRDGEKYSYYLLNGDDVSEYVSWDAQNKRYIVDLYSLVVGDVFNGFDSEELDYFDIYCDFSFIITVHAEGYNDLSKEYSGNSSHEHNNDEGGFPPDISLLGSSDLSTFVTVSFDCSIHSSYSDHGGPLFEGDLRGYYGSDVYAFERTNEDYYVTVYAEQRSAPEGLYWGNASKTFLIPAKKASITISRFLDNEPHSYYGFYFSYADGYSDGITINPDLAVIGEKESLVVAELSQWLSTTGCTWGNMTFGDVDCNISIDGQTVSDFCCESFYSYDDNLVCVVDLLPYGNAFGGNHQFKVTATDRYNSLSVDTVLSYHPIDTILTPYSLVIDVNSGIGGCSLFVDDEEVELSNDGPGTPAHIYALPRKDHDYSIIVQVGNVIANSDDDYYEPYQGRCQETTIVVPAKDIFDFEEDGVYYSITSENEVIVANGEDAYQGVIIVPSTVTYDGVTYTVTGIGYDAFADANLTNLVLPVTISSIDSTAFTGCHIGSLIINGNGAWTAGAIDCDIDNLYVMSGVTGIQGLTVNPVATVYSYSTLPPACNEQTFIDYNAELHVPATALAAYFTAPYWNNFINISSDAVEPMGVTLDKDSVSVLVGNQFTLTATPVPANATPDQFLWTSSDETIATVENGVITAVHVGECDIKAYLLDKMAVCHVVVTEIAPTAVTVNPDFAKLELGSQMTLTATVMPEDATDKVVTWETTNSDVATVDSLGTVTAVGSGECFVTATCRDKQATCHIIVVDHFVFITLDEHEVRLMPNHMVTLTPSVMPEGTSLVVTSSNPVVAATRMANGKIQVVGITEGRTIIKVNSTDGYAEADSCLVKVYTLRGDVNGDGFINIADVTTLINYVLGGNANGVIWENADANNDKDINVADVTKLISAILSGTELDPKEEPIEGAETFTVNGVTFTMMPVEGGTFTMGATPEQGTSDPWNDERPTHEVTLSTFSIGETEVTQALWQAVMGSNPSEFTGDLNHPVEMVSWDDCQAFITQLNQLTGRNFRLPTEAEWEYAARGGNKTSGYKYAGGNDINELAWWDTNAGDGVGPNSPEYGTHPVRSKKANELGLYDMSGNVWEWCQDWYGSYSSEAQTNPTGPATGSNRVYRGGSWLNYARNCRVSSRYHWTMNGTNYMGLRLAL